jgi:hypothetical protein
MIKCKCCGAEINSVLVGLFDHNDNDADYELPLFECPENAVYFETATNWTGYDLSESEQRETITCPKCHKYPFEDEIQVDNIVRVVMFKAAK